MAKPEKAGSAEGSEELSEMPYALPRARRWRHPTVQTALFTLTVGTLGSAAVLGWVATIDNDENKIADVFTGSSATVNARFTGAHVALSFAAAMMLTTSHASLWKTFDDVWLRSTRKAWSAGLWMLLATATLFMPVFWNAVLFPAPAFVDYNALLVTPSFLTGAPYQSEPIAVNDGWLLSDYPNMVAVARLQNKSRELTHIDAATCKQLWMAPYLDAWSNLVLVSDFNATANPILEIYQHFIPFPIQGLIDGPPTKSRSTPDTLQQWKLEVPFCNGSRIVNRSWFGDHDQYWCRDNDSSVSTNVEFCLGEPLVAASSLQMSVTMLAILLALHILLLCGIIALCAYLPLPEDHPDAASEQVASLWMPGFLTGVFVIMLIATLKYISLNSLTASWNNVGFGQFDPAYLATGIPGIFRRSISLPSTLLVANLPQLAVAVVSMVNIRLLTKSRPRSSAQAGFGKWVPMIVAIVVLMALQWCVSQALFPVRFQWYDSNQVRQSQYDVVSEGYSFRSIVASLVIYFVLTLGVAVWSVLRPSSHRRMFSTQIYVDQK